VLRWRRDLAARNIARSFPEKTQAERTAILEQSYRNMSEVFVELLWGWRATAEQLTDRMTIDNPELVARFVAEGRSVIALTAHVCNWEWLLPGAGAHFGIPIDAVYKPIRVASLDTYMREARGRFGGQPIPIKSFAFELLRRAGQPRAYGLVADQTPLKSMDKHWTRFLNQDTAFFVGAEKIARFLEAPVVYVAMRRVSRGRYAVHLHVLAEPPYEDGAHEGGDADTWITEAYARKLEAEIRASPADWLWVHNKWKYPRPE
jgi:KDO2-lipid IV(A) lauroyltransferase